MNGRITNSDLTNMLMEAARCLRNQHELLTRLDSVAGDGDHGTTMLRAAEQLEAAAHDPEAQSPAAVLKSCGWKLLSVDGGASSSLLGSFFTGMGDAAPDGALDCEAVAGVFESGLDTLLKLTKARVGDKTMVDALAPAVAALRAAALEGKPVAAALEDAAAGAQAGADSTATLVARFGRARFLGEKTLGHADAGAASVALLFRGFSRALSARREIEYGGH